MEYCYFDFIHDIGNIFHLSNRIYFYNNTYAHKAGCSDTCFNVRDTGTFHRKNNILYRTANGAMQGIKMSLDADTNVWYNVTDPIGDNQITGNPSFVSVVGDDYAIQSDSSAKDVGLDLGSPMRLLWRKAPLSSGRIQI